MYFKNVVDRKEMLRKNQIKQQKEEKRKEFTYIYVINSFGLMSFYFY